MPVSPANDEEPKADTVCGKTVREFYNHADVEKNRTVPFSMIRTGGEIEIELYTAAADIFTPKENCAHSAPAVQSSLFDAQRKEEPMFGLLKRTISALLFAGAALMVTVSASALKAKATPETNMAREVVAQMGEVSFSHSQEGWRKMGFNVRPEQAVTILGEGQVDIGMPVPASPSLFLWARIGADGPAFNVASEAHTFVADRGGELYLAVRSAGMNWTNRRGSFTTDFGGVPQYPIDAKAQAYVWSTAPDIALTTMAASREPQWLIALDRYRSAPKLPEGFAYLWYLGQSTVFEAYKDETHVGVRGTPSNDAGIIRKALDIHLDEDTQVSFDWLFEQLPAKGPETEAQYHDYLSIALEFDNGQDLTWFWSAHLEPGTEFTCPLPGWDQVETHIAIQSGDAGLGEWHSHTRPVLRDYASAVGGQLPNRIVGVWFINSGVFGDKPGEAVFANVNIRNNDQVTPVFQQQ